MTTDEEGRELDSLALACAHGREIIADVITSDIRLNTDLIHLTVMIHDQMGLRVATVQAVTKIVETCDPFLE